MSKRIIDFTKLTKTKYSLFFRPTFDLTAGFNVTVQFKLRKLLEFNEKKELLTTMYQKVYVSAFRTIDYIVHYSDMLLRIIRPSESSCTLVDHSRIYITKLLIKSSRTELTLF